MWFEKYCTIAVKSLWVQISKKKIAVNSTSNFFFANFFILMTLVLTLRNTFFKRNSYSISLCRLRNYLINDWAKKHSTFKRRTLQKLPANTLLAIYEQSKEWSQVKNWKKSDICLFTFMEKVNIWEKFSLCFSLFPFWEEKYFLCNFLT